MKAIETVSADVSPDLKETILSSAKKLPSQKNPRNLRYFYHAAVGERKDLTYNLDFSDRMTNSTSCTVRQIDYRLTDHLKSSFHYLG